MNDLAPARIPPRRVLLSLLALAVVQAAEAGCGGRGESSASSQQAVSSQLHGYDTSGTVTAQTSGNFARLQYDADDGVENNDWGVGQNGQGGSTSFLENVGGHPAFGWAYDVYDGSNVVIFPEVGYGWSPNGNASWGGTPTIPQLGSGQVITTNFDIVSQHSPNSDWDLAFDIWITSAQHPASTVGSFELMIWLDHEQNGPWSTRGPQGLVNIDGVSYQRYTNAGAASWTCLSYVNQGAGIYAGSNFNVTDVIKDAAAQFGIPSSYYVASIELGNEIVNGSGMTEISNWAVQIGTSSGSGSGSGGSGGGGAGPAGNFQLDSWQYSHANGVTVWNGGVGNFVPGNWIEFDSVNLSTGYDNFAVWYATTVAGSFDVTIDSPNGAVLCTVWTSPTGGWSDYTWGGCNLNASLARGVHNLYYVPTRGASNLGATWIKNL